MINRLWTCEPSDDPEEEHVDRSVHLHRYFGSSEVSDVDMHRVLQGTDFT